MAKWKMTLERDKKKTIKLNSCRRKSRTRKVTIPRKVMKELIIQGRGGLDNQQKI